jgi:hypothetical protein
MTVSRTTRRIATAVAAAALVAGSPGLVGVASAHDNGGTGHGIVLSSELLANTPLVDAIRLARTTYRDAAKAAIGQFRTDMAGVRAAIDAATQTQRATLKKAHDDYEAAREAGSDTTAQKSAFASAMAAYRDALMAARAAQQPTITAATGTAKAALAAAETVYVAAVNTAFATYAPGTTVPPGLLTPGFGRGMGHGMGHGLGR